PSQGAPYRTRRSARLGRARRLACGPAPDARGRCSSARSREHAEFCFRGGWPRAAGLRLSRWRHLADHVTRRIADVGEQPLILRGGVALDRSTAGHVVMPEPRESSADYVAIRAGIDLEHDVAVVGQHGEQWTDPGTPVHEPETGPPAQRLLQPTH